MRRRSGVVLTLVVALLGWAMVSVMAATAADQPKVPEIPGITVADTKPNGCNDCHRKVDETRDYSLAAEIKAMVEAKRHPRVPERMLADLPKQCVSCHKPDGKQPFSEVLHKAHLTGGAENHFITNYQGQCMYCHKLDPETGRMSVKGL